jgi:hypothetical protein
VLVRVGPQIQEVLCGTVVGGDAVKTARLQVVLAYVEPPVLRVIDVPSAATLPELHDLLQAAIGWTDSHLHQFVTADATYGMEIPGVEVFPEDQRDETGARLADLTAGFEYHYDFGDGWIHDVEMLGRGGEAPGCVDGHGACPPEDCGGPGGYAELLDTLADPADPDHERMRDWVGNRLRPFDRPAVDARVRQVVGDVPESVRLLLDLLADGVKLTPGGRLPRRVVRVMQAHRPRWHPLGLRAWIEDDLWPLTVLHELLRRVGLARLAHGVLRPTRAAGDDLAVVRRLRSAFEPDAFVTEITELSVGVLAADGPLSSDRLAARVFPLLGHRWRLRGEPLAETDVHSALVGESALMEALDLIDRDGWDAWQLGPSARSLLPGASMLADVWGGAEEPL